PATHLRPVRRRSGGGVRLRDHRLSGGRAGLGAARRQIRPRRASGDGKARGERAAVSERAPDAARLRRAALRLAYGLRAPAIRYGLTPSRLAALVILGKQSPMRVGDLARELNIAVPSGSRLLDVLAESGFVERREDPTDGRAFLVSLTADGARILED